MFILKQANFMSRFSLWSLQNKQYTCTIKYAVQSAAQLTTGVMAKHTPL